MAKKYKKYGRSLLTGLIAEERQGRNLYSGKTEEEIRRVKESLKRKKGESLIKWAARVHRSIGGLP